MTESVAEPVDRSWRYYFQRPVLVIFFLGFSGGLPFPLVYSTLTYWLAEADIVRSTISSFAWLGFAYSLKFLWSPLVDAVRLPLLSRVFGHRRSWLLLAQVGLLVCLATMARIDPTTHLTQFAFAAIAVAFTSATQDLVIAAYRIESAEQRLQGVMAASYQYGYRVAVILGTAGALFIAEVTSWEVAYQVMALSMAVGLVTTLLCSEPVSRVPLSTRLSGSVMSKAAQWLYIAVIEPLVDFVRRYRGWGFVFLSFIATFYISDRVLGIMAMPFYEDIGYTKPQIATIAKVYGLWVSILVGSFV